MLMHLHAWPQDIVHLLLEGSEMLGRERLPGLLRLGEVQVGERGELVRGHRCVVGCVMCV